MPQILSESQTASSSTIHQASPLIAYTLRGLRNCWMPELGRWSHIYHLDGRGNPNESVPESDVFYSLNVLLGFSRIAHIELDHGFDIPKIFQQNVDLMPRLNSPKYAYGMALWAGAELGLDIPTEALTSITSAIEDRQCWKSYRAQDLGMILIGCVEQGRRRPNAGWTSTAHDLFAFLRQNYTCPSGLFLDTAIGARRRFSSFATNTYLTLACYIYGEWSGNKQALSLANACTRKLIELQGPQGEWPWFFYTPNAQIVDFYEVYSVHQEGMAPAFLQHAERHGVNEATEALVKGFQWIFGQNQMSRSMLHKREGLICRSQVRKGEFQTHRKRALRAIVNTITGRLGSLADPAQVEVRLECRSYELGWILWSFGRRNDLSEIQHRPDWS